MSLGRPSKYRDEYAEEVVAFCADGYSLTAFAGSIDVARSTINEWIEQHPAFSEAVSRAKNKRALWWEDRARNVAMEGGPGGQATMVIFGLKNHAPEDFSDKQVHEHGGPNGGPINVAQTIEIKQAAAKALFDATFGTKENDNGKD